MSFLNNIKLNYRTKLLNQAIESKNFSNFKESFNELKKINLKIANKFIKYNATDFIENNELNFLFNKNIVWVNSFRKKDTNLLSNFISEIFQLTSNTEVRQLDFYKEVLSILEEEEVNDYKSFDDIFLKSHYYFQILIDNQYSGTKLLNTNSALFEFNKTIHFTHHKLSKCFFYVIKHPYQIFTELKNEGLDTQAALSILCNFEDRPSMVSIKKNGKQLSCPENSKSWQTNVSSWTNENAQISLRGLTIYYDDMLYKTEDKLIEIAAHLKESGFDMALSSIEISKIANNFKSHENEKTFIEISNKEKKIIDRECGDLIEKYFSDKSSN
jgi:hypothetical protein